MSTGRTAVRRPTAHDVGESALHRQNHQHTVHTRHRRACLAHTFTATGQTSPTQRDSQSRQQNTHPQRAEHSPIAERICAWLRQRLGDARLAGAKSLHTRYRQDGTSGPANNGTVASSATHGLAHQPRAKQRRTHPLRTEHSPPQSGSAGGLSRKQAQRGRSHPNLQQCPNHHPPGNESENALYQHARLPTATT